MICEEIYEILVDVQFLVAWSNGEAKRRIYTLFTWIEKSFGKRACTCPCPMKEYIVVSFKLPHDNGKAFEKSDDYQTLLKFLKSPEGLELSDLAASTHQYFDRTISMFRAKK